MRHTEKLTRLPTTEIGCIILVIVSNQVIPLSDSLAKLSSDNHSIIQVIWARFFFYTVFTGLYLIYSNSLTSLAPSVRSVFFARGALLLAAVSLFYGSLQYLPVANALSLWFIQPFALIVLSSVICKERIHPLVWASAAIGLLGVIIANRPEIMSFHWSMMAALASGIIYAVFLLLTKRPDKAKSPMEATYQTGLVGTVISSAVVIPFWNAPTVNEWMAFIFIGLLSAFAHFLTVVAYSNARSSRLAPFSYTELVGAAIFGFIFFSDVPSIWTIVGLIAIAISGMTVVLLQESKFSS